MLLLALSSLGCASPTGYSKRDPAWGSPYGYSDKQMAPDEFSIFVEGNPRTSAERVAEIALYRAAHLAIEQGRTHFVVLQQKSETERAHELVSLPLLGLGVWIPVAERPSEERSAILLIRLLPGDSDLPESAVDAEAVIARLRASFE